MRYAMSFSGMLTIFSLSAISGCMVGPTFHAPNAPPITTYTASPPIKTVSAANAKDSGKSQYFISSDAIPADWWSLFHSEALNRLIETGLTHSPNLTLAQATLRQAEETFNAQIGAALYPAVNGQVTGERQRFSDSSLGVSSSANIFNLYNASVGVTYTLDVFGAARRGLEALRAQVDYQSYELEATYLALTSNIVTTAIANASYAGQVEATHTLIKSQENQLKIVRKQRDLGGASGADVFTQESQLAETRASLPPLAQSLVQSQHALSMLIGAFPEDGQVPIFHLAQLKLPIRLPVSLPSELVRQRPDIKAAEALLHAASAEVGVATANLYPQITLNGNYGWQGIAPSNLFKSSAVVWSFGGGLLQPIFNGGSLQAKRRAAIAAYEQAEAQYRQTVLQAFQNVSDVLRALQHDAELLRAEVAAEVAAHRSLHLTEKQYQLGGVSYLSLLTAQRQYQQAIIGRIQAEATRYADTAALFQALGGGWWHKRVLTESDQKG